MKIHTLQVYIPTSTYYVMYQRVYLYAELQSVYTTICIHLICVCIYLCINACIIEYTFIILYASMYKQNCV